jgi:hypothetical protein
MTTCHSDLLHVTHMDTDIVYEHRYVKSCATHHGPSPTEDANPPPHEVLGRRVFCHDMGRDLRYAILGHPKRKFSNMDQRALHGWPAFKNRVALTSLNVIFPQNPYRAHCTFKSQNHMYMFAFTY